MKFETEMSQKKGNATVAIVSELIPICDRILLIFLCIILLLIFSLFNKNNQHVDSLRSFIFYVFVLINPSNIISSMKGNKKQ